MGLIGGCSHSPDASSGGSAPGVASAVPRAAASVGASGTADARTAGGADSAPATADAVALSRSSIRTARIAVSVRGAARVVRQADAVDALAVRAGGEVDADERTGGPHASATVRLAVPPVALASTLTAISRLGRETSRQVSSVEVSAQVADVASRVSSGRAAIARLRSLFARSATVSDVIAVENELSSREADLESLEAQQRTLSRQTALAAISVTLTSATVHRSRATHSGGFVGGVRDGWHAFAAAASWVATALGAALPFLAVAALIAAGVTGVLRRRRPPPRPGV